MGRFDGQGSLASEDPRSRPPPPSVGCEPRICCCMASALRTGPQRGADGRHRGTHPAPRDAADLQTAGGRRDRVGVRHAGAAPAAPHGRHRHAGHAALLPPDVLRPRGLLHRVGVRQTRPPERQTFGGPGGARDGARNPGGVQTPGACPLPWPHSTFALATAEAQGEVRMAHVAPFVRVWRCDTALSRGPVEAASEKPFGRSFKGNAGRDFSTTMAKPHATEKQTALRFATSEKPPPSLWWCLGPPAPALWLCASGGRQANILPRPVFKGPLSSQDVPLMWFCFGIRLG